MLFLSQPFILILHVFFLCGIYQMKWCSLFLSPSLFWPTLTIDMLDMLSLSFWYSLALFLLSFSLISEDIVLRWLMTLLLNMEQSSTIILSQGSELTSLEFCSESCTLSGWGQRKILRITQTLEPCSIMQSRTMECWGMGSCSSHQQSWCYWFCLQDLNLWKWEWGRSVRFRVTFSTLFTERCLLVRWGCFCQEQWLEGWVLWEGYLEANCGHHGQR